MGKVLIKNKSFIKLKIQLFVTLKSDTIALTVQSLMHANLEVLTTNIALTWTDKCRIEQSCKGDQQLLKENYFGRV